MSELEHVVLGVVWREQPCTAYAVRKVFLCSPSSHWSGSAGAIYPLMKRLERAGLLRSNPYRGDKRRSRLYRLTPNGRKRLRNWLRPPLPPGPALMNIDPVRVRVSFFGALTHRERLTAVREAQASLREQLRHIPAKIPAQNGEDALYDDLVNRGALLSIRAQLAWLKEVEKTLQA